MRKSLLAIWLMLAGMLAAPMTFADIHVLTGANGIGQPDPQFSLVMPNGSPATAVGIPTNPAWVPPTGGGQWIGPAGGDVGGPVGTYTYTFTFTLCRTEGASISGVWASDNGSTGYLNGTPIFSGGGFQPPAPFAFAAAGSPPFQIGENTLKIEVYNGGGPTGFFMDAVINIPRCVCCLDYDWAVNGWQGHPDFNLLGFDIPVFPPVGQWVPVAIERFISCYEFQFPDGMPVNEEYCRATVGQFFPIPLAGNRLIEVLSAHWYPTATLNDLRRIRGYLPFQVKLLATDVNLAATLSDDGSEVNLTLTTSAEDDTATLTILRGEKLENGGTSVTVVCKLDSGGSPYTCTDSVVGDDYRVLETEYDGRLIVYDVVKPKKAKNK